MKDMLKKIQYIPLQIHLQEKKVISASNQNYRVSRGLERWTWNPT